jgi:hypothetical protein
MPSLAGVMPKREPLSHTRRSQASAIWLPPPIAKPSMRATVGLGKRISACSPASTASPYRRAPSGSARSVENSPMSAPEENGPPGVPRTTTTSQPSSCASSGISRPKACHMAYETALCLSGRVKATVTTPPSRVTDRWGAASPSTVVRSMRHPRKRAGPGRGRLPPSVTGWSGRPARR